MNNILVVIACVVGLLSVAVTAFDASDCWDLMKQDGITESGSYTIYPVRGLACSVQVWCDMETDGGGWTVLQRRFDGSLNFTRDMTDYEQGFGDVTGGGEYWLGLAMMHALTSLEEVEIRFDLCTFEGESGFAVYEGFKVSGQNDTYRLSTGTYREESSLRNWWQFHNGKTFVAAVPARKYTCSYHYKGGWWYHYCVSVNLNGGQYHVSYPYGESKGITWSSFGWDGTGNIDNPSLQSSDMKIRPINAAGDGLHSSTYTCPT